MRDMLGRRMSAPTRRVFLTGAGSLLVTAACRAKPTGATSSSRRDAGHPRPDLYACEGCEGALERDSAALLPHAIIAPPGEAGERLRIEGRVLQKDRRTPAEDVVLYAYHTDAGGRYSRGAGSTQASRRHGLLRGWVRTRADGRYSFDTIKPAPYPGERLPAHIHLTVLESGRRPYWIDDIVFEGEFGVTDDYRRERENRGGDGIVRLSRENGILIARRDIVLETHP